MAAMTESELSMLNSQYMLAEPQLAFFLGQDTSNLIEFDELERRLFMDSDLDANFESADVLAALPQHSNDTIFDSKPISSAPKKPSFSTVSDELNSLSLDQLIASSSSCSSPLSNKRISESPLASPKKHKELAAAAAAGVAAVDSKDGILRSYDREFSPLSAFAYGGGIAGHGDVVSSRMQRSYSSHALGQLPSISTNTNGTSALDSTMQGLHACSGSIVPSLSQLLEVKEGDEETDLVRRSPRFSPASNSMRRVCSTGDIQRMNTSEGQDECGFKIGKYSLAERKERIHRYRQKRSERNFNKKIKYACRKTLADSRPRVRGRFAKNEDVVDHPNAARLSKMKGGGVEYDDEVDALLEDDESLLIDRQSSGELSECWRSSTGIGIVR